MLKHLLASAAIILTPTLANAACPAITVADPMGIAAGAFPQQYELTEFQAAAGCTLAFAENPAAADLNARIQGNTALPPVAERLPEEPLVVVPQETVGSYGGTLRILSNAPESGTADGLSIRHVNFVRYADDLQTIVPNVAKSWEWNADFTALTFHLRKGHKWSDGTPFTSADVKFWYDNIVLDPKVYEKPKGYALVAGKPMEVIADDPHTVTFKLPSAKPGLLSFFAVTHVPPFLPKHFLGLFHPAIDRKADENAKALGFADGYDAIKAYYGNSDWTDTPTPMLSIPDRVASLPRAAMPTLESLVIVAETPENRKAVANPYFFMVDTAGNQLPYIPEMDETYTKDAEVRSLKMINGEIDYKAQSLQLAAAPLLLEKQEAGKYSVWLKPKVAYTVLGFNQNHEDEAKRAVFADLKFRQAMSVAIDRAEINEVAYYGLGEPVAYTGFSPLPSYVDGKWSSYLTEHDPEKAKALLDEIGLVDKNGDGFRDLANGETLLVNLLFSTQAISTQEVELVAKAWSAVGIKTAMKEVTSDEYRQAQAANKLDLTIWEGCQPVGNTLGDAERWKPPFGGFFGSTPAMLWGEWVSTNGASGLEPPAYVKDMMADVTAFQSATVGSPESVALANKLVATMTENLVYISTVRAPGPIYKRNALKNVPEFKAPADEFRWAFPYRPQQWFLAN